MGYRGEDLDLRTPQSWSATAADLGPAGEPLASRNRRGSGGRNGSLNQPIYVDETLLASCNHAFDVALAHRSAEVRLEHLLHALTRIDTAAEILESRGIRVAGLRRDTATVIAGELPVAAGGGAAQPRRSVELAEVLRLAAADAARRNNPAGVDDVLAVLFAQRDDFPGAGLLFRHSGHGATEYAESPVPVARYVAEPRYAEPPEPVREPARARAQPRPTYRPPEPPRPASSIDSFQNARLDALEQAVRSLGRDLADERSGFAGILQDLQRDLGAHRADQSRSSGGLQERLEAIEQIVSDRVADRGMPPDLAGRLNAIETGVQRYEDLARSFDALTDRLRGLEDAVRSMRAPDLSGMNERMRGLEDAVRAIRAPDLSDVHERVAGVERTVRDSLSETSRTWLGLSDKLKDVEAAIVTRAEPSVDLTPISNRLDIIEEALLGRDMDAERELANRLGAVEQALAAQRAQTFETSSALGAEVKALAGAVATQSTAAERFQASVGEKLGAVSNGLERHRVELVNGIERHRAELIAGVERQNNAYAEAIEQRLGQHVSKLVDAQGGYSRELGEVHDALVKLNANQHTLAGAIDKWRTEGMGDLSVIANRIAAVEREAGKPMQLLSAVAANMDTVHRIAVEKNNRRRRFWYWLFGTDDWLAASWPRAATRIDTARGQAKTTKV